VMNRMLIRTNIRNGLSKEGLKLGLSLNLGLP